MTRRFKVKEKRLNLYMIQKESKKERKIKENVKVQIKTDEESTILDTN